MKEQEQLGLVEEGESRGISEGRRAVETSRRGRIQLVKEEKQLGQVEEVKFQGISEEVGAVKASKRGGSPRDISEGVRGVGSSRKGRLPGVLVKEQKLSRLQVEEANNGN